MSEDLRYPIGRFSFPDSVSTKLWQQWLDDIARTPEMLRHAVTGLEKEQLDTAYRDGGWTLRQVVHHLPDSHLNSYVRFKLALTEDSPVIKPYLEDRWATLPDYQAAIEPSLSLIDALHGRWMILLRSLGPEDLARQFQHPESGRLISLERNVALYAWHGKHHVHHILSLRERMKW